MGKEIQKLVLARTALERCNEIHEDTGRNKIPLEEVAEDLKTTKEAIQDAFDYLVSQGVIGDDGDRDHMNYSGGGIVELLEELITEILLYQEEEEEEEEEKEEDILSLQQYT